MKLSNSIAFLRMSFALTVSATVLAHPVALPDPDIKGYRFPESKDVLMSAINKSNAPFIQLHGWGLWTALTMPSGQDEFGMTNVPVFLTWKTPSEIAKETASNALELDSIAQSKRRFKLEAPRQFSHGRALANNSIAPAPTATHPASGPDSSIFVTMGYNPSAAEFAKKNQLLSLAALQKIYDNESGDLRSIPSFPNSAVATKPVYKIITQEKLSKGHIYTMHAWPGTPQKITPDISSNGFPETSWPGCVYVDINIKGKTGATGIDANCKQGAKPSNTYGLGDFVSFPITRENKSSFDVFMGDKTLVEGDVVLLIGMHVSTREIDEWTWQTYFWTPNPSNPPLPSSAGIGKNRPSKLVGAASHYAMSIGYQMVSPNQPTTGGKSVGNPVVVFNPYLESVFPTNAFNSPPENPGIVNGNKKYMATVGIQTNCMTCHMNATLQSPINSSKGALPYLTDFYVSRDDPAFKGFLQLDFLWSIQGAAR